MIPESYPFIIDNSLEKLAKTKDIKKILEDLGLKQEMQRASIKTVRAGKGKSRGRKYKRRKGILLVVSEDCNLTKSARNIPGTDIIKVNELNAEVLAPGTMVGRLTLFTQAAIEKLDKEKLFMWEKWELTKN